MSAKEQLGVYLDAAYPVLAIQSHEEDRVEAAILEHIRNEDAAEDGRTAVIRWSLSQAVQTLYGPEKAGDDNSIKSPVSALQYINTRLEPSGGAVDAWVWILRDFCHFLTTGNAYPILRQLKDIAQKISTRGLPHSLIIIDAEVKVPKRLEKTITVMNWPLPTREELADIVTMYGESQELELTPVQVWEVSGASLGLTVHEVGNALASSFCATGRFDPRLVTQEKKGIIKRSGFLEFWDSLNGLESVGGMGTLKGWLSQRKLAFSQEAREYRLPLPKGLLLVGVPGGGKSWIAKAIGGEWNLPVLRLDMGKVMGSYLGQSERQLREALDLAELVSPVILWCDELEKSLGSSGGEKDGGTSQRVFGTWLTWMQEKTSPVFVVATANDVSKLPPEAMRAGRFDSIFFVDLPNQTEREEIFSIHLRARGRKPTDYNLNHLAQSSKGYTGAEIETLIESAMFSAFAETREFTEEDVVAAQAVVVPISRTMKESLQSLRSWAEGRAVYATAPETAAPTAATPTANRVGGLRGRRGRRGKKP